ncbi:hypothetical protein GJ496_007433 [Pomphorhynchus laevis]|nr:hypothetical protein GJ496_007433 [Pomphorhynchus laevis]
MPVLYEVLAIHRCLEQPHLVQAIKRVCKFILDEDGILVKMENMGNRVLPYRMKSHNESFSSGHYILTKFYGKPTSIAAIKFNIVSDVDVIRARILNSALWNNPVQCECEQFDKYIKDRVDYTKPVTVWGKRIIDPLYRRRL